MHMQCARDCMLAYAYTGVCLRYVQYDFISNDIEDVKTAMTMFFEVFQRVYSENYEFRSGTRTHNLSITGETALTVELLGLNMTERRLYFNLL